MAIRSNLGTGVIAVGTTDSVMFDPAGTIDRYHVGAFNVFNTDAINAITMTVYVSPDLTSASGVVVGVVQVAANQDVDVNALVGQGHATTQNIIVTATAAGLNASLTRTEYDAGS